MSVSRPARRAGVGSVVFALILIAVGGYDLLRDTLGVDQPPLESEQVVPVIAVIAGITLLYRAWRDRQDGAA